MSNLLTSTEQALAVEDVRALILAAGQTAVLLRAASGERLFGSDDAPFEPVLASFPLEVVVSPSKSLAPGQEAAGYVLPDLDVRKEDRIAIWGETYRVQTVRQENLFGQITHQVLDLVRLHV